MDLLAEGVVGEAGGFYVIPVVYVASVKYSSATDNSAVARCRAAGHHFADSLPSRHAEFFPFGYKHDGVGSGCCVVDVGAVYDFVAKSASAFVHGYWVVYPDCHSGCGHLVDEHERGCFSHVVGLGLESESPHCDGETLEFSIEVAEELLEKKGFLTLVHFLDCGEHTHGVSMLFRSVHQCLYVLGEA